MATGMAYRINKKKEKKPRLNKIDVDLSKRLYLRMPYRIKEIFEIQEMHPLIKRVILSRQRGRYCFLEFDSEADTEQALADLTGKELNSGRHIVVKLASVKSNETSDEIPFKFRIQRTGRKNLDMDKFVNSN